MQNIADNPFLLHPPNEMQDDMRLPYFTLKLSVRGDLIATSGGYYDLSDEDFLNNLIDATFSADTPIGIIEEYNLRFLHKSTSVSQILVYADISSELATLNNLLRNCIFVISVPSPSQIHPKRRTLRNQDMGASNPFLKLIPGESNCLCSNQRNDRICIVCFCTALSQSVKPDNKGIRSILRTIARIPILNAIAGLEAVDGKTIHIIRKLKFRILVFHNKTGHRFTA